MKKASLIFLSVGLVMLMSFPTSEINACTRVVYHGTNNNVMTARSMDWKTEIPANLWVLPRGIERNGLVGPNSVKWTVKYGSLVTTSWDIAVSDGMNEKGLVANLLWLAESKFPDFDPNGTKTGLIGRAWCREWCRSRWSRDQ